VLLLAVVALGVPLAISLKARVNAEVRTQSQASADLVAATAADLLGPVDRGELTTLAQTAARSLRGRILVVNGHGIVLVDSAGPAQVGVSYDSRPEIQAALRGRPVQVQRSSRTLGQEILATAVPIIRHGRTVGAVRVTQSVAAVNSAVDRAILGLAILVLVVLTLGLLAGTVIAAQVVRPIRRLEQIARRVAGGDLEARARLEGSSEQRSLAASFNEMTDRILRLLHAQRDFVADASHQLRTPLTAMRLRLEAAGAVQEDRAAPEVTAAIAEVDRLSRTVDELLVLSEAGERQFVAEAVDLGSVARAALTRWRGQAAESGIRLELREGSAGQRAWLPRQDLETALDALIDNALRYSPRASTVTIVIGPERIEVQDEGPGIPEEERELVFERFHRGQSGRRGPVGSGLGLAIARELARVWGGDVGIDPRPGGGTIAWLSAPGRPESDPVELQKRFASA
jgi:signal transduction histidine kinase